ncbi:hypothetical protein GSI_04211 [Ganoderma sinense ZZ0214-1]|uniref:Uncharacterized protein n=1 Tax=Ganoderma sinense ZZ0214-1 TaxID=1077348 RepID=A0A2G8SJ56_9APHY|nr:hypothetical protein GSI_04211 [Ganoderma sinense ZZ0214-1]
MELTTDTSLFVWGTSTTPDGLQSAVGYCDIERAHADTDSFLFAPGPSAFKESSSISYEPPRTMKWMIQPNGARPIAVTSLVKIPTFTIAPYAVHAHVPVLEISGLTIAVIFCTTPSQAAIGLILTPCPMRSDPSRPLYHTGGRLATPNNNPPSRFRICLLNSAFHAPSFTDSKSSWKDVYITHLPPPSTDIGPVLLKRVVSSLSAPFRFSRWEMERLQERGFYLDSHLTTTYNWQRSSSDSTIALVFKKRDESAKRDLYMEILLGQCDSAGSHWASIQFHDKRPKTSRSFGHSCLEDHVSEWLNGAKTFEAPQLRTEDSDWSYTVSLSLTPCPMNPTQTRLVKVSFANDQRSIA